VCDTLCVRTSAGMVFAKNSDRPPNESQVLLAHRERAAGAFLDTQYLRIPDPGAHAFVGSHPAWLWGAEHGVNEHGVAIGNEKIWTVDDPKAAPPALIGMDLVRLGLERSGTADEALDAITGALAAHGQGGSGELDHDEPYFSSFLLADAHGGWIIETSGRTWAARPVGDGSSISNRVSLATDWTAASADVEPGADFDRWRAPDALTAIADHRLAATRACVTALEAQTDVIPRIVATLRDHGSGPWGAPGSDQPVVAAIPTELGDDFGGVTVCMHVRDYQATTASMVAELQAGAAPRAWACLGNPCVSVYVPFFPPTVPAALADPAQWARYARLRDRAESDPDALGEVRAVLAPLEHELWTDADERFATGERGPLDAFATTVSARVDRALDKLGV
jgi:secernin